MTLLRYLLKKVVPAIIVTTFFFAFILDMVDILINLWLYIQNGVPFTTVLNIMWLYAPKALWYAAPLGMLFAVSYTLSGLYSGSEMNVIFASGISLFRFTFPILVLSAGLSVGFFFFEDRIVVPMYKEKVELQKKVLNETKSKDNNDVVVIAEAGAIVYRADYYDSASCRLFGLYVVERNPGTRALTKIIRADSALWNERDGYWLLQTGMSYHFDGEAFTVRDTTDEEMRQLVEVPETFQNPSVSVEEVNVEDARKYIALLQRTGLASGEAESLYHKKFAFPAVIFLVAFLAVGLTGRSRRNVLLMSIILCVSSAVLFYVSQMVTMYMAKFEYISAVAGAWLPVVVFVIISMFLLKSTRT